MAQAARAYRLESYPEFNEERFASSDVRVIRAPRDAQKEAQATLVATAAKMAAILLVVIAALCFARIALMNAAVTTMIESDTLSTQISDARSSGVSLEMEQSVLSSPSAINAAVKRLHMVAPYEVGSIVLDPDVVATDANGALSLSDSVKNVAGTRV